MRSPAALAAALAIWCGGAVLAAGPPPVQPYFAVEFAGCRVELPPDAGHLAAAVLLWWQGEVGRQVMLRAARRDHADTPALIAAIGHCRPHWD